MTDDLRAHRIGPDGENTESWAIGHPGFLGSMKQFTHCARCGQLPPHKRLDEPRRFGAAANVPLHLICDDCYDALPDDEALAALRAKMAEGK